MSGNGYAPDVTRPTTKQPVQEQFWIISPVQIFLSTVLACSVHSGVAAAQVSQRPHSIDLNSTERKLLSLIPLADLTDVRQAEARLDLVLTKWNSSSESVTYSFPPPGSNHRSSMSTLFEIPSNRQIHSRFLGLDGLIRAEITLNGLSAGECVNAGRISAAIGKAPLTQKIMFTDAALSYTSDDWILPSKKVGNILVAHGLFPPNGTECFAIFSLAQITLKGF